MIHILNTSVPLQVVLYQEMLAEAGVAAPQPDNAGSNGDKQATGGGRLNLKGFFR